MEILNLVEDSSKSEFYPTPNKILDKMFESFNWGNINTILEPSAGKGDILKYIAKSETRKNRYTGTLDVDCIEIDPNLRAVLKYNFSNEYKKEIENKKREYCANYGISAWGFRRYERNGKELKDENYLKKIRDFDNQLNGFFNNGIHIVHDNFLTYQPFKEYDLIVMNPPFSNGDKHLLKALEMQRNGGSIICLLNAETLRNPYTNSRKELLNILNENNAIIEYVENGFSSAERKTNVEVAIVKVHFDKVRRASDIYEHMKQEEEYTEQTYAEVESLIVTDFIKQIISQYKVEIKAGIEFIETYHALVPYMPNSFNGGSSIINLSVYGGGEGSLVNQYVKAVRSKYWKALLENPKFVSKLTSKLKTEYNEKVCSLSNYDFSEFNIKTLISEMNMQVKQGVEEEALKMFDRLTEEHAYYPECSKNRHLYTGWKTNKAHKIGKKVIIPCNGFDCYTWSGKAEYEPRVYKVLEVLPDIERVLNFFDGHMSEDVNLEHTLREYFGLGVTKNIPFKYFTATFYKKGTVHLVFNCPKLIERFNIYAGQRKGWLPPCYGYKKYKDMDKEEKVVVDEFQGENAYSEVLENSNYYLGSVTENVLMLGQ